MSGMELTHEQYERIADCLPVQRGNVRHDNLVLLNAILYVAEHGASGEDCRAGSAIGTASMCA